RPTRIRSAGLGLSPVTPGERVAVVASGEGAIENGVIRVEVESDGTFVVVDKATGERTGRLNTLVSEGDRGDEYTYSYAGPTVGSRGISGTRRAFVSGDRATVAVELVLRLPARLRDDRLARAPDLVDCPVRAEISLAAATRRVEVTLVVTNRAQDHRLRVLCETGTR